MQNAAARLLTGTKKGSQNSSTVLSPWFPVKYRIDFNILLLFFKAINNFSPNYICNLLGLYTSGRSPRSTNQTLLTVPVSPKRSLKLIMLFLLVCPKLWNGLPLYIRQAPSIVDFRSQLKTHLFSLAFEVGNFDYGNLL